MSLLCRELSSLSPFSHSRFFSLSLDYIGLSDKDKNELTSPISLNKPVKFDGWVLSQISSWNGVAAESLIRFSTSISGHYNPTPKRGKKNTLPPCPSLPLRLPFFSSLFFLFLLQSEVKYRSSFGNGPGSSETGCTILNWTPSVSRTVCHLFVFFGWLVHKQK